MAESTYYSIICDKCKKNNIPLFRISQYISPVSMVLVEYFRCEDCFVRDKYIEICCDSCKKYFLHQESQNHINPNNCIECDIRSYPVSVEDKFQTK